MISPSKIESSVDWADYESGELFIGTRKLSGLIREADFIDTIFHSWLRKKPSKNEKKMLNAVIVSFSGGWGFFPPTVMASRLAASTKAPMSQCLAAGFCASGPAHAGAIEKVMEAHLQEKDPMAYMDRMFAANMVIPGFGHPSVKKDPRPDVLRKIAAELGVEGEAVGNYDIMGARILREKKIHPNIDAINGAILVDLGFRRPGYGTAFFLLGRMLSLTAHIMEEYERPPFHVYKALMPARKLVRYTGKP